jgi:hypothetical protein
MARSDRGFFSLSPEDVKRYWQLRDALEYVTSKKGHSQWLRQAFGRASRIYKCRALLALQLLSRYPALFIDINGLCYVADIPCRSKDQRNLEVWLKKVVEGKWWRGWEKVIERVKVHAMVGTCQSLMRPLKNPGVGMIYPRRDITIERGNKLPRSKWAYRLRPQPENEGAFLLMDLTGEDLRFDKEFLRRIDREGTARLVSEYFSILSRIIDLMAKCGLKLEEVARQMQMGLYSMHLDFESSLQEYGGRIEGVPLEPDPSRALRFFQKRHLPKLISTGKEWVFVCANCGGDNVLGTPLPSKTSCFFCGASYKRLDRTE